MYCKFEIVPCDSYGCIYDKRLKLQNYEMMKLAKVKIPASIHQ
jgi:hypothetical protein